MNNKYDFDDITDGQYYSRCLIEADFYPSLDNRYLKSNIEDIEGGDNFADFCRDFFELLDEEGYYDWFLFVTNKVIILGCNYQVEITA